MATIGNINIGITSNTKGLDKGLSDASGKLSKFGKKSKRAGLGDQGAGAGGGAGGLAVVGRGLLGPIAGILAVRELGQAADKWTNLNNRVAVVTESAEEQKRVVQEITKGSQRARGSLEGFAGMFAGIKNVNGELGFSNDEILRLTETFFKLGTIGGATQEAIRGSAFQMTQAFADGNIRAQDYNSVLDRTPEVIKTVAQQMGISMGDVRRQMLKGKLAAVDFGRALITASSDVDKTFSVVIPTASSQIENMGTQWTVMVGEINKAVGATNLFTEATTAAGDAMGFTATAIADAESIERQFFQDVADQLLDNPLTNAVAQLGGLQSLTDPLARGSAEFLGPNNPFTTGKITEENSKAQLRELGEITKAITASTVMAGVISNRSGSTFN